MTAALEGGEWSAARPGRTLPPGKARYLLYRRLGGPQGRSGRAENLAPPGFDPRTVQPVVSRYTVWATRPTFLVIFRWIFFRIRIDWSKICTKNKKRYFIYIIIYMYILYIFTYVVLFMRYVGKYGTARHAADENIIWTMRFVCWITRATNTNLEYVILTAFLWQQWLRERA